MNGTIVPKDYVIQTASTGNTRWSEEIIIQPQKWRAKAACAEFGGDAWFPEGSGLFNSANRDAKTLCMTKCTVREQCLEYALANDEREGIWAGLSGLQLANLRKKRAAETS